MTATDDRRAPATRTNWAGNHAYGAAPSTSRARWTSSATIVRRGRVAARPGLAALVQRHRRHDRRPGLAGRHAARLRAGPGGGARSRSTAACATASSAEPLRRGRVRAAQPRLAAAHLGGRARAPPATHGSGDRQRQPGDGGRGASSCVTGRRRGRHAVARRGPGDVRRRGRRARRRSASSRASRSTSSRRSRCARTSTRTCRWRTWPSTSTRSSARADSVSLFTDWRGHGLRAGLAQAPGPSRRRVRAAGRRSTARPAATGPIGTRSGGMPADACTEQLGVPGPWHERLPHFRHGLHAERRRRSCRPSTCCRARTRSTRCRAVDALRDRIAPLLQVSEIRTVAADDLWLSPAYGARSRGAALHLAARLAGGRAGAAGARGRARAVRAAAALGQALDDGAGRRCRRVSAVAGVRALLERFDPDGTFRNDYVRRMVLER